MLNVKILLFIITMALSPANYAEKEPAFLQGRYNLEHRNLATDCIPLEGEWRRVSDREASPPYSEFPKSWNASPAGRESYSLTLSSARPGDELALIAKDLTGFYAFYVNGRYIGGKGHPGISRATEKTGMESGPYGFTAPGESFDLTIRVSNYHNTWNPAQGSIYLASQKNFSRLMHIKGMEEFLFQGILLSAIIMYLSMYLMGRKRVEYLFFALMNAGLSLWLLTDSQLVTTLVPALENYSLCLRLNLSAITLAMTFFLLFYSYYRGKPRHERLIKLLAVLLGLTIPLIAFLPLKILVGLENIFLGEAALCYAVILIEIVSKVKKRAIHPLGFFPGFVLLTAALLSRCYLPSPQISDLIMRIALIVLVVQQLIYHTHLSLISFNRIRELNKDYARINLELKDSLNRIEDQSELIHFISSRDSSTGLPNKNQLAAVLKREMELTVRDKGILYCAMVEWEDYKAVLHRFGLQTQTEGIRIFANRANGFCGDRDWVCRYSDDRFLFLCHERSEQNIARKMEELLHLYQSPFINPDPARREEEEYRPRINVSYALFREGTMSQETLLRQLFTALDYIKKQNVTGPCCFNKRIDMFQMEKVRLETKLKQALKREIIEIHFQPQHESWQYGITGMEALMRWTDPDLGIMAPEEFIPLAEELGLIEEIDIYTVKTVLDQLRKWENTELSDISVSLNISPLNFVNPDFIEDLIALTENRGIDPSRIELELTETVLVYNRNQIRKNMDRLKERGYNIALDDFGTGYSSLACLSDFPVDVLKIDKAFVTNLLTDHRKKGIVNSIIAIGQALGMRVISEGVEKEEELHYLRKAGSHTIQGFVFSRALSPGKMLEYIRKSRTA